MKKKSLVGYMDKHGYDNFILYTDRHGQTTIEIYQISKFKTFHNDIKVRITIEELKPLKGHK